MLYLLLTLLLMGLALGVIFWAGSMWLQGYFYSEPAEQLYWRAPAASAALTLFVGLWCILYARNPAQFETLFNASTRQDREFPQFWAVKGKEKTLYKQARSAQGRPVYLDEERKPPKTHPDVIIVKEDGQDVEFKPDRDAQGNFRIEKGQSLSYQDNRGRVMSEDSLGRYAVPRMGAFFVNVLFNLFHLGLWFLAMWLLLRFQWTHALGLAVFFWFLMTLTFLPLLLNSAREPPGPRALKTAAATAPFAGCESMPPSTC